MRRWLGILAVLLVACSNGADTAAESRREEIIRAEAGREYRLRVQAEAERASWDGWQDRIASVRVPRKAERAAPRASRGQRRGGCARQRSLEEIARDESGGRYDAQNPTSSASGKYQVLDSTWDGYGGYRRAKDAPPEVQEQWAREAYARAGSRPWRASGC